MVLAKDFGEIVLTLDGHLMNHCRLHCKRKIDPVRDHAIVETQDHLVALKNQKRLMRTNLLQVGTSEADSETAWSP